MLAAWAPRLACWYVTPEFGSLTTGSRLPVGVGLSDPQKSKVAPKVCTVGAIFEHFLHVEDFKSSDRNSLVLLTSILDPPKPRPHTLSRIYT